MSEPMASILNITEIERRRVELKLTQDAAAQAGGFSHRQQWNAIEGGRKDTITLETLARLATALKCKPAELLLDKASGKGVTVTAAPSKRKPATAKPRRRALAKA
jgi:DNA-binding Xre family transcriptional regulator